MDWIKYPKIFRLGTEENEDIFTNPEQIITIEEKVDGGNGAFWREQTGSEQGKYIGDYCFASRTRPLVGGLENGQFKSCIEYTIAKWHEGAWMPKKDLIYYGEYMTSHTVQYDWKTIPRFLGFDIYNRKEERFLNRQEKELEFEFLNLQIVPLILEKKVKDLTIDKIEELLPQSAYGPVNAEGIVLKAYGLTNKWGRPCWAKIVRPEFKEQNKKLFGDPKKEKEEDRDTYAIYQTYFTPARYHKVLLKLKDEGHPMQMETMAHYPKALLQDFYEECLPEIAQKYNSINFKTLKKKIIPECVRRLKEEELKAQHQQLKKLGKVKP